MQHSEHKAEKHCKQH